MYSCTMPVPDQAGGLGGSSPPPPPPPRRGRECPKMDIAGIYGSGLVVFWGSLGRFSGPHDGYANS